MSNSKEGVVILLAPRTRVPIWLSNSEVRTLHIKIGKKVVQALAIENGQAKFVARDGVHIKMPRMRSFRRAFRAVRVFEIREQLSIDKIQ